MKPTQKLQCPFCNSKSIAKAGTRKLKRETVQRFLCNACLRYFTDRKLKKIEYPIKIILNALSTYNLGYTLKQTKKEMAKRFHLSIPESTIHSWVKRYSNICTFTKIRKQALKLSKPEEMILSEKLHHKQIYNFQLHKAKLYLQEKELPQQKFQPLKNYLELIPTKKFPHHIFAMQEEELQKRASQLETNFLKIKKLEKRNLANKLAEFGLLLAKTNKERHHAVQSFMLVNDSVTIATEVPVYLTNDDIKYFKSKGFTFDFENYRTPITGHIDILQIRNSLIHILDYKPNANKVNATSQLTIYALALASRTKLAVKDFKCAWFDDKHYYEFFPLHCIFKKMDAVFS